MDTEDVTKLAEAILGHLRSFDFDVDGVRAVADGEIQDAQLFFDGAVELAVVLMAATGGKDDAIRKLF